jgi:hypothetical protein
MLDATLSTLFWFYGLHHHPPCPHIELKNAISMLLTYVISGFDIGPSFTFNSCLNLALKKTNSSIEE